MAEVRAFNLSTGRAAWWGMWAAVGCRQIGQHVKAGGQEGGGGGGARTGMVAVYVTPSYAALCNLSLYMSLYVTCHSFRPNPVFKMGIQQPPYS